MLPPVVLPLKKTYRKIHAKLNKYYELGRQADNHYYSGKDMTILLYFMYLTAKYRKVCFHANDFKNEPLYDLDISADADVETELNQFVTNMLNCISQPQKMFVFPFIVYSKNDRHANLLIYRRNHRDFQQATKHSLEHFEPNGSIALSTKYKEVANLLEHIVDALRRVPALSYMEYVTNETLCPMFGLQMIETSAPDRRKYEKGYCAAWSMLITELALDNPQFNTQDILNVLFTIEPVAVSSDVMYNTYLRALMRGYTTSIIATLNKYYQTKLGIGEITFQKLEDKKKWNQLYARMHQLIAHVASSGITHEKLHSRKEYTTVFENITPVSKSPQSSKSKSKSKSKKTRRVTTTSTSPPTKTRKHKPEP